jgi:hypothetical protein
MGDMHISEHKKHSTLPLINASLFINVFKGLNLESNSETVYKQRKA